MKTEFLTLSQKQVLYEALIGGTDPKQYSRDVFEEIERLENIIKDHELTIELVQDRFSKTTYKKPKW